MAERQHLPIGTVVKANGGEQNLMITTLFPITEKNGQQGYFDFGAVPLPLGLVSREMAFFNREDIQEIIYLGYIDANFQQLIENYDELVSQIAHPHFTVEEYNR